MGILTTITRLLIELKNALNNLEQTISKYQESHSREAKEKSHTELKAVVSLPPEVTAYYISEERDRPKKDKTSDIRRWVEYVGLGVAIALAIFTFCTLRTLNGQLGAMRTSNELAKTQWEAEHRPWMGIDGLNLTSVKFSSSRPSLITLHLEGTMILKNFGSYPAFGSDAEITPVFPLPMDSWAKTPLGRPPRQMFQCSDQEPLPSGGEVVFPTRDFTHPFQNDMSWGWKGRNVEVPHVWLLVCIFYSDGRQSNRITLEFGSAPRIPSKRPGSFSIQLPGTCLLRASSRGEKRQISTTIQIRTLPEFVIPLRFIASKAIL
jgi:hypothetical protein